MSYRTILVHADAGIGAENRVRLAARLARRFEARLIGAAARLPLPLLEISAGGAAVLSAGMMDVAPGENEAAFKAAEALFFRWIAGLGLESEWRTVVDFPSSGLAGLAAAADLVIVGGREDSTGEGTQDLDHGDLVMKAGRPVLVVPSARDDQTLGTVLVAWKNTREARRALADALPFLKIADRVVLAHVREGRSQDASLADAQSFLEHHQIEAPTDTPSGKNRTTSEEILASAERHDANLIVAGAYGHTRLREWAFGGVTRELLAQSAIPCLFGR